MNARLAIAMLLVGLVAGANPAPARADLTPAKTYNAVNRPLIARVEAPGLNVAPPRPAPQDLPPPGERGPDATSISTLPAPVPPAPPAPIATPDLHIDLFRPGDREPAFTAPVLPGEVDLAAIFPVLWTSEQPGLFYAQARTGREPMGPPLVLQPMMSPARAALDEREPRLPLVAWPASRQPKRVFTGIRAYPDATVRFTTDAGVIEMRVRPDLAPNTVWTFRELVAGGFYDGVIFHRAIASGPVKGEPFLVQAGDPTGTGEGGPGFEIAMERSALAHDYGVVSLARQAREVNSGSSQFFICLSRAEGARLDGQYTAFAEVIRGMDVVGKIVKAPLAAGTSDRPQKPVAITRAELVPAAPYGRGAAPERVGGER